MIEEIDVHAVVRMRVHASIIERMPLSAKKVAASYGAGGVRVPRAPLIACLSCPLCGELFREATTVSECLHTFCRDCIQGRLSDGETNSCPMCNVSLGTLPLEKLRADHQLDDVKAKLFPDFSRKRKNGPGSSPAVSAPPARRKERSLYSLGIGSQPQSANPGFATRATRSSPGKAAARETSSSEDEEQEEEDEEEGEDEDAEDQEEEDDEEPADADAEEDEDDDYVGKQGANGSSDSRSARRMEVDSDINDLDFIPFRPSRPKEEPRRAPLREPPPPSSEGGGIYLARRSLLTVNGAAARTRSGNGNASVDETGPGSGSAMGLAQDGRGLSSDNLLATLAEVAESSGISKGGREQPQIGTSGHSHGADIPRGRDNNSGNDRRSSETRPSSAVTQALDSQTLRASPPRAKRSSPQLQRNPSLKLFANGGVERAAIFMHPNPHANGSPLASTSFTANNCGIWFALQAARNQADNPLPQLSSPYLRIKDGKLPVSHVKKYLVKKLGLSNETEVEITCRGQPVVSSLPLESVRNIWFATAAAPSSKDQEIQGQASKETSTALVHIDASSAKEMIMVLTYQRHRRNTRIC
ncbi:hypothetical protein R1sor_022179 [Riccia sorocarpa]|uniref:RING-type domain-containing protein n=1 Tax=Riccia sorocarpa TaxID=122646 RepID=A0ABD3GJV0_9MARC